MDRETNAVMHLFKICLYFMLIIHLMGCIWSYVVTLPNKTINPVEWVPPLEMMNYVDSIYFKLYENQANNEFYFYIYNIYYACLMITLNDLMPKV